jgi:hypothetical protein
MKKLTLCFVIALAISACNDNSKDKGKDKASTDTVTTQTNDTTTLKEIKAGFTNVDPAVKSSLDELVGHYLHVKNALVDDNSSNAAAGGKAMVKVMSGIDQTKFTPEQKAVYLAVEDDLKEHAEHIGSYAGHIEHQREHFAMMSEDMYDIVKSFGSRHVLYHDQCPMANDNKGALWLSETREIHNPYFADKMNNCVKIVEKIK